MPSPAAGGSSAKPLLRRLVLAFPVLRSRRRCTVIFSRLMPPWPPAFLRACDWSSPLPAVPTLNNVLREACRRAGQGVVRRFVHVSTDEVYGETDKDAAVGNHEASQLLPTNPYSASKAAAEILVMAYRRSYGLPAITTRGNNVYGPHLFPEKLLPKFILLAMHGSHLPVHGDGSNVKTYLYCEDVAEAFDVVVHRGEFGRVYSIGTTRERCVADVANHICQLFGLDPGEAIRTVNDRPFNDHRYFTHDQKLKALCGRSVRRWEEGIKKTADWYVKHDADWCDDVSAALLPYALTQGC